MTESSRLDVALSGVTSDPQDPPAWGSRVARGTAWVLIGFGVSQLGRLAGNVVLAALLFQEAFALMAIVSAIVQGLAMFSDIGLGPNIVQSKRGDDRDFLDTAWTLQVLRGVILASLALAMSWPVAAFYAQNDPQAWQLLWLMPLVAVSMLVDSLQSTKLKTANRHVHLGWVTFIELASQLLGLAVTLALAWWTRSVLSIAIGGIAGACTRCLLSHIAQPGPANRWRWDRAAVREIVRFGKWIFLSTAITFLALQIDKLVFARMFPLDQVGVYAIAASLAIMTPTLMGRLQSTIVFPLYARMLDRQEPLSRIVARSKPPMLLAGAYLVSAMIACAGSFVDLAYDDRYQDAAVFLRILSIGAWFAIIDGIYGAAFLASGRAHWVAAVNATKVASFCLMLPAAVYFEGIVGAVWAAALSDLIKLGLALVLARRIQLLDAGPELRATVAVALSVCAVLLASSWVPGWSTLSPAWQLICQAAMVTTLYGWPLMKMASQWWRQVQRP